VNSAKDSHDILPLTHNADQRGAAVIFEDRYSKAVRSSNLKSKPETRQSDSDIIGAAGLAAKHSPLAIALLRFFVGGDKSGAVVVEQMTRMAIGKAYRIDYQIGEAAASIIARMVLDWHRDSACKSCGGHGFQVMANAPMLSDQRCQTCGGSAKRPFDLMFQPERLELARWLLDEVERETSIAGPLAMVSLASQLDL